MRDEISFPLKQRQYRRKGLFSREKQYEDDHISEELSRVCELVGIDENMFDENQKYDFISRTSNLSR